ncbi:hypothetical protein PIB30_040211 [Stylosanthes scabra]|uniref:Uncharacterized protein n=1 Tax=Stylosanthes scabra TaxID=79078 RepID=A0ABU6REP5_9FABA|nr:hypothetical protein [Stylosanthes scabra]
MARRKSRVSIELGVQTCHLAGAPSDHVSHPESSSGSGSRTRLSDICPFRPPRDKASFDLSDSADHRHPAKRCPIPMNQAVVDNADPEDEDYVPDADEMASFDDHLDNLFAKQDAREQNKGKRRKDNDWWSVEVIGAFFLSYISKSCQ